ncbi:hypothetical protein DYB25_000599 [Aphanomyces astaci]|uniref:BTB domain-containing protein n=1 Tax=Aphanomyces astaci TaxID=112090 RepID=A0A397CQG5_APHAT|nr:hypothetical protein DYB25_000599 [Aphanomyces astaci]RHX99852.1 hypothetical protein DYB36_000414 [Aphanomyces astaci]RHY50333.1 hypothetical protein DYB38_005772 [Aphanomyces astaci]RHY53488.1 hypothetical protein DYB34_006158 [Aphanomyces astaci]RHY59953.1 hypothetical protein DYB30_000582 [Aphanomyces astaci]
MQHANIVTLNVGGRVFQTTRATLLNHDGSYFDAMLTSGQWQPDAQGGAYFIDLDPVYFDRILNYLRFGDLVLEGLANWETILVIRMMQYLSLDPPRALGLLWDPSLRGHLTLSNQCRTITAAASFSQFAALGLQSTRVFSLHIDAMTFDLDKPSFRVGFANRDGFESETTSAESTSAWLVDVRLSGPEQFTTLGAARRPKDVVVASVGDVVTVHYNPQAQRLDVHKHGDIRHAVHVRMAPTPDEDGPYPCVALKAAQSTNFTTSIREWVTSQVTFVETPPVLSL